MPRKKKRISKTVETITHDDATRKNIPTAEYQSVMRKDEETRMLEHWLIYGCYPEIVTNQGEEKETLNFLAGRTLSLYGFVCLEANQKTRIT